MFSVPMVSGSRTEELRRFKLDDEWKKSQTKFPLLTLKTDSSCLIIEEI